MAVQRGRSERKGESYFVPYVEPLSDARTKLADFFSIMLELLKSRIHILQRRGHAQENWSVLLHRRVGTP